MSNKSIIFSFVFILMAGLAFSQDKAQEPKKSTKLEITVLDDLGTIIEGADVFVFATEEDYRAHTNEVARDKTDEDGKVKIKGLRSKPFFIYVSKGKKNNDGLGSQTEKLERGKTTRLNIVISG